MTNPDCSLFRFFSSGALILVCSLFILPGCSLKEVRRQSRAVEDIGYIRGKISHESKQQGVAIVLRFRDEDGIPVKESQVIASSEGEYKFPVGAGRHYIAAFIDTNNDNTYQPEEHGNYHGVPSTIEIAPRQTVTLDTITITGPIPKPETEVKPITKVRPLWENIGQVVTLDDPRFNRENYSMGLWKPFQFLDIAEGGLFFIEDFQEQKIPVILVHGVLDGPTLWKEVIENLDHEVFQPWTLYYPTGIRLEVISDYFLEAVAQLQNKYGFSKFYVLAHSMGGLVTRSFVKKYVEHSPENIEKIGMVMTINSPMNGMSAAASGVRHSPIVVPSWRDVEPGSDFLHKLHSWNWPDEIPYHLVISYVNGESGDGVVPLNSQSQFKLQTESTRMYIFNNDHAGTLRDKQFHALLNTILDKTLEE